MFDAGAIREHHTRALDDVVVGIEHGAGDGACTRRGKWGCGILGGTIVSRERTRRVGQIQRCCLLRARGEGESGEYERGCERTCDEKFSESFAAKCRFTFAHDCKSRGILGNNHELSSNIYYVKSFANLESQPSLAMSPPNIPQLHGRCTA